MAQGRNFRSCPVQSDDLADRDRAQPRHRPFARPRAEPDPIEEAVELADDKPTADAALQSAQEQAQLQRCLDTLAGHERAALRSAFFDGNTYEELAERMKVPLGTMKSWIRRAMIKLKVCLEQ